MIVACVRLQRAFKGQPSCREKAQLTTKNMTKSAYSKDAIKSSVMVGFSVTKKMMKATNPNNINSR